MGQGAKDNEEYKEAADDRRQQQQKIEHEHKLEMVGARLEATISRSQGVQDFKNFGEEKKAAKVSSRKQRIIGKMEVHGALLNEHLHPNSGATFGGFRGGWGGGGGGGGGDYGGSPYQGEGREAEGAEGADTPAVSTVMEVASAAEGEAAGGETTTTAAVVMGEGRVVIMMTEAEGAEGSSSQL